jgi:membrane protease YdiL (CAAX protease family)
MSFSWPEFAILCAAALLGVACVTPYAMELSHDAFTRAQQRLRRPPWVLAVLSGLQGFVLVAVATGPGLLVAHHLGRGAPLLEGLLAGRSVTAQARAALGPALLLGAAPAALVLLLEIVVFWPRLPAAMRTTVPIPALWKRFLASFYGGIAEELLCRLFLLSLLAWPLGFWPANVLAAVIFGLGHLPTTAGLVRLNPLLITRAVVLNGIVGVAAGYLYWRYGLEAAMLAHFVADLVLHVAGDSLALRLRRRIGTG